MSGRRSGPAAPAGPHVVPSQLNRLAVTVVSPDAGLRARIAAELSNEAAPESVGGRVRQVATRRAYAALQPDVPDRWNCLVVDARLIDAAPPEWTPPQPPGHGWPVLYVDEREAAPASDVAQPAAGLPTQPGGRYAPDLDLAWDPALGTVPFRTRVGDPTFGPRLRTRVTLLPADVRSQHLYAAVTQAPGGPPPPHADTRPGCARCGRLRPPVRSPVLRGTRAGAALLRLLLRPERYVNGVSHAVFAPGEERDETSGGARAPGDDRAHVQELEKRRKALNRACEAGGLVTPLAAAHVALVLRVSALTAAYRVGIDPAARLLGFGGPRERRGPARTTLHRILASLTREYPHSVIDYYWADINESARLALLRHPGIRVPAAHLFRPRSHGATSDVDAAWGDDVRAFRAVFIDEVPGLSDMELSGPLLEGDVLARARGLAPEDGARCARCHTALPPPV